MAGARVLQRILGSSDPIDIDSNRTLLSTLYLGVIAPEVFIVQPGFVQGMVKYLGFSEVEAGRIASSEMWGLALTTVLMTYLATRVRWRHIIAGSLLVMTAGNLGSILADSAIWFGLWRFLAGLGAGAPLSLGFAIIAMTKNRDRNFGWIIMWVLVYGAAMMLALPEIFRLVGINGAILFFALFPASGLLIVRHLPNSGAPHEQTTNGAVILPISQRALALGSMFSYFLGQGVIWAYLFLIGLDTGASEQEVTYGLTACQFAGVAGAMSAALLGNRIGHFKPLLASITFTFVPLLALFDQVGALIFGLIVCIYNYAWNVAQPFLLASLSSFDSSGRTVVNGVACQMLGLANGPWIAALMLHGSGYDNVLWFGIALFAASLALITFPLLVHHRIRLSTPGGFA